MRNRPTFSIITVSYNSFNTIRDTLNSLLNQTCSDFEYIIIDGGSTDDTQEIILEFEKKFIKSGVLFTWLSEKDNGIYDAMNKGIALSNGEWVGIVNSDDFLDPAALEIIKKEINKKESDVIHGNIRLFSDHKTTILKPCLDLKQLNYTMTIFHPSVFVKNVVYKKISSFDLSFKLSSDWDLIKRIYNLGFKITYVDSIISNFRSGGAGSGFKKIHLIERYKIRHTTRSILNLYYDLKDILIFIHHNLFPNNKKF